MTSAVDLHLHSNASDGTFSPEEIVIKATRKGLKYISLTDHDTIDGVKAALTEAKKHPGLTIIPGIEISTDHQQGLAHVLGYFIDFQSKSFKDSLNTMKHSRKLRAQGMIEKLKYLGILIDWEHVKEIANGASVGRPHLARAMLEKGYIDSIHEAFIKYIGQGGPAYVERIKTSPEEAIKLILESGGMPVLAHPLTIDEPETMIERLKTVGLIGIEAYYGGFSNDQVTYLVELAERYNLITTGGSDYHGFGYQYEVDMGSAVVPIEVIEQLLSLHCGKNRGETTRI